ncbi:MAG: hypothetical protein ABI210_07955 [Abditibacteriaceae bacterium]
MSRFRDNTNRIVLMLGALVFLFTSSSLQACVVAGGDCVSVQQAHSQALAEMLGHAPAPNDSQVHATKAHSQHASTEHSDDDCCQLISANTGDISNAQVSNPSASQLSPQWFHLHFASLSSFHYIDFAQREIFSPPPEFSLVFHSPAISSLNAGRAPPLAVLA